MVSLQAKAKSSVTLLDQRGPTQLARGAVGQGAPPPGRWHHAVGGRVQLRTDLVREGSFRQQTIRFVSQLYLMSRARKAPPSPIPPLSTVD